MYNQHNAQFSVYMCPDVNCEDRTKTALYAWMMNGDLMTFIHTPAWKKIRSEAILTIFYQSTGYIGLTIYVDFRAIGNCECSLISKPESVDWLETSKD